MRTGRPTDEPKKETVVIRMDYKTKRILENRAFRQNCSTSELIRIIINEYLERN